MNLFLVFGPGHSGTAWFSEVCNQHPAVKSMAEACHELEFDCRAPANVWDAEMMHFLYRCLRSKEYQSVGFVKGFRQGVMKFVLASDGRVIQLIRNPIEVVDFKFKRSIGGDGFQAEAAERYLGRAPQSDLDYFEGQVLRYANTFNQFRERASRFPLVRIEDLDYSLYTNGQYFKLVMEHLTQVPWSPQLIAHIRDNIAPGDEDQLDGEQFTWPPQRRPYGWQEDPSPRWAWECWSKKQRELFIHYFNSFMVWADYGYPT
jgi:hypothetical protein